MLHTFAAALDKLVAARAFPVDTDVTQQKGMFNEALEKIVLSGRWNGTQETLNIAVYDDMLTLPRHWQTVIGIRVGGYTRDLASIWYSFAQGMGDPGRWSGAVQDQGDGFATFAQPDRPAKLKIASTGATGTVRVLGLDANGDDIWTSGERGAVITIGAAAAGPEFIRITKVIKPVTANPMNLWAVYDDDDAGKELIGAYEPGETVPNYRRYLVAEGGYGGLEVPGVVARVQRRHVDLVADNDICPIDNFGALKRAIASIHWDNEGDENRSEKHFSNAMRMLNDELKRMHPPTEVGAMRVSASYATGAHGIYNIR